MGIKYSSFCLSLFPLLGVLWGDPWDSQKFPKHDMNLAPSNLHSAALLTNLLEIEKVVHSPALHQANQATFDLARWVEATPGSWLCWHVVEVAKIGLHRLSLHNAPVPKSRLFSPSATHNQTTQKHLGSLVPPIVIWGRGFFRGLKNVFKGRNHRFRLENELCKSAGAFVPQKVIYDDIQYVRSKTRSQTCKNTYLLPLFWTAPHLPTSAFITSDLIQPLAICIGTAHTIDLTAFQEGFQSNLPSQAELGI